MLIKSTLLSKNLIKFFPLYVVFGDELLLVQESLTSIRKSIYNFGFTERKIFYADGNFDWSLVSRLQTGSLFDTGQILEIRVVGKLNKHVINSIESILVNFTETTSNVYLFVFSALEKAFLDSSLFKLLAKIGLVVQVDAISREQLGGWIRNRLMAQKQFLSDDEIGSCTLDFIIESVEGNLLAAHQEILKLGLMYPIGELSKNQVVAAITNVARFDIFKFRENLFTGKLRRLINMLYSLRAGGESPALVLWAIVEELRSLNRVLFLVRQGVVFDQAVNQCRVWGKKSVAYKQVARKISINQISVAISFAFFIDCQIKGILQISECDTFTMPITVGSDAWESLLNLVCYLFK